MGVRIKEGEPAYSWNRVLADYDESSKINLRWVFRPDDPEWHERCHKWYLHITVWEKLKHSRNERTSGSNHEERSSAAPQLQATEARIEILFQHLGILDSKFGTLLTLNGLLVLMPGYLIAHLENIPSPLLVHVAWILITLVLCLWGVNVFLCLISLRRIIWGNLGVPVFENYEKFDSVKPGFEDYDKITEAENRFVKLLIMVVVDRSNNLRIAMWIEKWMAFLMVLFFAYALYLWSSKALA